jgi:hypothetical protein
MKDEYAPTLFWLFNLLSITRDSDESSESIDFKPIFAVDVRSGFALCELTLPPERLLVAKRKLLRAMASDQFVHERVRNAMRQEARSATGRRSCCSCRRV